MKKSNLLQRIQQSSFTPQQRKLAGKYGTPTEFAKVVYKCVPSTLSKAKARAAVDKYCREWVVASN